ncbi:alpha/beta-hydrolase [Conidiobolus coronatus NRRL 28638]|uniref:Alpha/beta-hydrolase n=1 Tax=Conidiobolus coronatus (strain ATCC 28846 / CBS 209.66 / NRRL 28638) TaxID=796925 RepID=A0A137P4P8_CONC2|nr:alpha/beta-hydrolase [Conidiobolus coronatus NRRL 28638]|eukprot:KXN69911.1 alpha/beta-hydrolase [Conidiobolus coronatus NRRL 28638]
MTKSPLDYNHKYTKIDGFSYHYVDEGSQDGELLVFVHGWPELWINNKHQIDYFSKLGYRTIAIDLIGIGGSQGPKVTDVHNLEAEGLTLKHLIKGELKRDQAIFIGHDWGSMIVWRMCQYFPEIVKAVASTCIHYTPPMEKFIDMEALIQFLPGMEYQKDIGYRNWEEECKKHKSIFFEAMYQYNGFKNKEENSDAEIFEKLTDLKASYERIKLAKNYTPVFNEEEFKYFLDQYSDQVIANSCNYYRTRLLNHRDELELMDKIYINHPALMIHATEDVSNKFYVKFEPATKKFCTNLTYKVIEGDHWIILNKGDEVNEAIHSWLSALKL